MPPKHDIGWDFCDPVGDSRKHVKCKFCKKVVTGGITRLKQHIAHVSGNVEACPKAPREIAQMLRKNMQESKLARDTMKRKKEAVINTIQEETMNIYESENSSEQEDDQCGGYINKEGLSQKELKELKNAMRESRKMATFEEDMHARYGYGHPGAGSSQGPAIRVKQDMPRSFSTKEGTSKKIDSYMFPSKQKSLKSWFAPQKVKGVGKAIAKFFLFNAIPFHAADSGPYYQSMINTIAEAGPGIKGPTGRQIGGMYLEEEVEEIDGYIRTLKMKWPEYGCTIMCDGWSTRNKHPILNFMIYSDRHMIFHSSIDCTNKKKTADYILSLMNKVIDEVGEENVVQVVTDSESANKAAGQNLMLERRRLFWSPCAAHCIDLMLEDIGKMTKIKKCMDKAKHITSFIYNSDKLVNLMKIYTNDRELLRPGITRFATEFIAVESLLRHQSDLKKMFTSSEWDEYNIRRRKEADRVCKTIMDAKFWKKAREVQSIMEPLVKLLKIVDQDKKPTLAIIYEGMDRAKMAIKDATKDWEAYWAIIDERWYRQLHQHLHAAAYFLNPTLQYSGTCVYTDEVRQGLKVVIKRLEPDLNAQSQAINEIKLFRDKIGEFGSPLARRAIKNTLPAEWWINYGDEAPHLRKIAVKVLSQTCSSTGCERNWSTWSLIHTKLRNRLAIAKLHKLVYVHYNMRLRMRNFNQKNENSDYDLPIDLNQIFHDDDILDEWTRENEPALLSNDDMEWLDREIPQAESNKEDDNLTINDLRRAGKKTTDAMSKQKKGKNIQESSDSSDSDETNDSDSGDDDQGPQDGSGGQQVTGAHHDYNDSQRNTGMSWAQGNENFYATQDTDHGYRPGIEEKRRFLAELSSADEYSNSRGTSRRYSRDVNEQMENLDLRGNYQSWHGEYPSGRYNTHYDWSSLAAMHGNREFNYGLNTISGSDGYRGHLSSHGIGYHGHGYGTSTSDSSNAGYRGFGYYRYDDGSLTYGQSSNNVVQPQSISSDSSIQSTFPLYGYPGSYYSSYSQVEDQFSSQFNNPSGQYGDDFVPPRHSTWY